jgi:pSer/pThr/pTyr-binding forkhead associated (FHA) protein
VAVTLTITAGPEQGRNVECNRELVIGRADADVVLTDEEVSGRHAVVRPVEQGLEIEDLGSMNGTFVNGERISGPTLISREAELKLGATQLTVEVPAQAGGAGADARPPEVRARQEAVTAIRQTPPLEPPAAGQAGLLMKTPIGRLLRRRQTARLPKREEPPSPPQQ